MTPITSHHSNEEGPSPKIEAAVDGIESLLDPAAMDISELEAQLTEEPNVTKVVPSVYLELATESMMHIQSLISPDSSNSVPINRLQCQYIFDKLCETLNNAKECICGSSLQDVPRSDCIFQNLAQTAMEVDKLVGDCCDAQWIRAAMIVANAKEHFASLAFKLRLYRQLLQSIFEKKATKMLSKLQTPKWSDDIKDAEFSIMDRKVQEDRKWLLSRLTQVGSSESENLIKRLDIFSIRGAFLQHNASFVLDPWKVEWKSIKRFRRSQIGKGSFAVVRKVEWLGKDFAEKSFPFPENETFRKEVSFLAGLSHPNILPLFCYATGSRYCSLVMELMDEDLDSLMRNRLGPKTSLDPPFELLEAIDIMLQVAEGMKYLHQNKVMHRDLKAGNILVKCDDGHVYAKVADFGVSKTIDSRCTDSNQTTDVGTTKWMAPELFSEESHDAGQSVSRESDLSLKYPFKVDIYSFGMVCYEILTGCIPFANCNNMRDLRKRIKDGLRPDIPEGCPEQLSTLIKKCYHPNPAERPSFRKICVELRHLMWSLMLNNLELGDSTAKWSNLPGAEHLSVKQFQELFSQHKYKEAADFAADSPQGILRTPETVAKFQSIPVQPGQTSPVVQYFGTLLRKGKLNVFESLELSRLIVNQKKKNLLEKCLAEDKLECSEELGDLVKTLDNDMAFKIYNKMRENAKMVAAVAENGQFERNLIYSKQGQGSLPHSPVGRGSPLISPLVVDLDQSHQQVPEDVYRKFHEFNLQGIGIKAKKLVEEQVNELKSFSESLKEPKIPKVVPSAYLEFATKSMMHILILISPLNQLQCLYLLDKLCETLNDAKAYIHGLSPQNIERTHHTLEYLARTAKEVEILVGCCCDAEWIQAAMIFANAQEHFASLTFKLRLYMELLQSIYEEGATKEFLTKLQDQKWIDGVKDEEFHFIAEKAKEDRQRLLSRLTHVGSSDSENLIRRLKISSNRATFLQESATNGIDAWKVEYESIHRVPSGQIGKGLSATVHKVTWLGKDFAEKCFPGPENLVFQEQVSLLAGLSHPNILPLFCYATGDHRCSLVMELMDEDLRSLMERRLGNEETLDAPFKLLEAVDIMLQVAEGMNYLHQNRVVHRDLKSMNILVKYNEHDRHVYAKVADFELSRMKELSCTYFNLTMNMVSPRWMAPELFGDSGDYHVGPSSSSEFNFSLKYRFKVDIYSFGMVCYEILTGCIPFFNSCNNFRDLRKRIKDGLRPDIPERCPKQLATLIQACYHSNPTKRPSFREICVELRHIMCSLMVDSVL